VQGERPSFDELMAQSDERDYRPLVEHLDDRDRDALGLPPTPQPVTVDGALADRIRDYYFTHPDLLRKLPDSVRDLINL
jgi:hypothetical protein